MNEEVWRDATGTIRALANGQLQLFDVLMGYADFLYPTQQVSEVELWGQIGELKSNLKGEL